MSFCATLGQYILYTLSLRISFRKNDQDWEGLDTHDSSCQMASSIIILTSNIISFIHLFWIALPRRHNIVFYYECVLHLTFQNMSEYLESKNWTPPYLWKRGPQEPEKQTCFYFSQLHVDKSSGDFLIFNLLSKSARSTWKIIFTLLDKLKPGGWEAGNN